MKPELKTRIAQINAGIAPAGYKKTKVGIVPEDWKVKNLSGILHPEFRPVPKPNEPYTRIGIRSHAKGTFQELVENPEEVNMDVLYEVKKNDLIVNITFAWEHAIALATDNDDGKLVSHRFPTYVFDDNSPLYYRYVFCQEWFRQRLELISPGGAGRNRVLNKTDFLALEIFVPPLSEQQKIAEILTAQDSVISLLQKRIELKQQQKKALMQKLLSGEVRVGDGEWKKTKIGKLTTISAGATPDTKRDDYWNGDIRWMSSGELNQKRVFEVEGRITQLGLEQTSTKILPCKCVLIGLAGQGKTRGTAAINYVSLCTNQSIAAIWPSNYFVPEFLYYLMDSKYTELRMISSGDGTRGGLNLTLLGNLSIELPPLPEQEKIAEMLSAQDREIELMQQQLALEQQKKKALMQLLLTGKVRCV